MSKVHRHRALPETDLSPNTPVPGVGLDAQARHMEELRRLQNRIGESYRQRDERMVALILSNALSRADMALATGLAKSRVDQIVREKSNELEQDRAEHQAARVSRHVAGA